MTEPARRFMTARDEPETRSPYPRPRPDLPAGVEGLEKVLRFTSTGREGSSELFREPPAPEVTARDIAEAMNLVHTAAATIREAEERAREGEVRAQALLKRATEELKSAESRIQAAEARAKAAEAKVEASETRAREAENWLRQIFSTIAEELPAAGR